MKTLNVECAVPNVPVTGSWAAELTDGSVVVEGQDNIWWPDVADRIKRVKFMGLELPEGTVYTFGREAMAVPGAQGVPHLIFLKVQVSDGIELNFRFIKRDD